MVQTLFVQKKTQLKKILTHFFEKKLTRHHVPTKHLLCEQKPDKQNDLVFELACRVYKRGFLHTLPLAPQDFCAHIHIYEEKNFEDFLETQQMHTSFLIVDFNFFQKHFWLKRILKNFPSALLLPTENTKNIDTVSQLLKKIPQATTHLFVLGGGLTLDVGGFVAALLSLQLSFIPTTVLGAVDAAIGGKTGVNFFPYGKNQVGLFYHAHNIFCVLEYFHTLPTPERDSGLCEALKHSWIFGEFSENKDVFERLFLGKWSLEDLRVVVLKNFSYKSFVVSLDPFETKNIRVALNFGHTVGHVLEALAKEEGCLQDLPHGIAVAHGMFFLFQENIVPQENIEFVHFLKKIVQKYPVVILAKINLECVQKYLCQDKKNEHHLTCRLSVPPYGFFSLQKNKILGISKNGIKNFCVFELAQKMHAYFFLKIN
jgi:3-dehydroquinate synthase